MRTKKVVEIKEFNNFNDLENGIKTKSFYNYLPTNKLKNSKGIAVAKFPYNINKKTEAELNIAGAGVEYVKGLGYFKQFFPENGKTVHRLFVYANNNKIYFNQLLSSTYELFDLYDLSFDSAPIILNFKKDGEDASIMACDNSMTIWITNYSPYTIENVPIITSMCMNEGVLFCTIKEPAFKIWYATDLDAENIGSITNNSGYVSLEDDFGYARKVVVLNEDVYVFRDYGISKINHIKNDISASQIYSSNTLIYSNTVCVCGNSILFMTNNGLYSFNGVKVSKMKVEILNGINFANDSACAASMGEKYYLALRMNFEDNKQILCEEQDYVNNALLIIDTANFNYEIIRGVDINSLLPIKTPAFEKMLVVFNSQFKEKIGQIDDNSQIIGVNLPKFWCSDSIVENYNTKLFTKLIVKADKDVKISLKHENKQTDFHTYTSGVNEFAFKLCCKDLKVEISSNCESANVESVELNYYEY